MGDGDIKRVYGVLSIEYRGKRRHEGQRTRRGNQGRAWLSEPAVEPREKRMSIEVRRSVRERRVRDDPPYQRRQAVEGTW